MLSEICSNLLQSKILSSGNIVIILAQEKGQEGMKKRQGRRRDCQISITIRQRQKILTLYQIISSFMTLKEMHFENVKKQKEEKKNWI